MTVPHITYWFGGASDGLESGGPPNARHVRDADHVPSDHGIESWSVADLADRDLVAAIAAGDELALRTLYDRVYPSLWDFSRSVTESRDAADDLAQEAMTLLWMRAPAWDPQAHVRGFLFTAVRHLARNASRRQRTVADAESERRQEIVNLAMSTIPATPAERLEHAELIAAVGRAVAGLPDVRRMALLLRWREQLPYEEIARVLGVSTTAAHHLVARARAAVRIQIAPLLDG